MLVVDEVHHLVGREASSGYAKLSRLARASPKLLLLSATPVLDDTDATLRLFHLVDPAAYRLEESAAFAMRIERRQEIGRLLLVLASDGSAFVMSRAVDVGRKTLADDADALLMLDALNVALDADDEPEIAHHRSRLREYLSDTYQLSKRLVRSRRRDLAARGMFSRNGAKTVETVGDAAEALAEALDDWRVDCAGHLYAIGADATEISPETLRALATSLATFRALLDGIGVGGTDLVAVVQRELARSVADPLFAGEHELLKRLQARVARFATDPLARCRLIHHVLGTIGDSQRPGKLVVFASSARLATEIDGDLPALLGYGAHFLLTAETSAQSVHALLWNFERLKRPAVLVMDGTGEDGLNLQFADAVIHLDLPTSLMRIEQRMGRLDRIGRGVRPIRQHVVVPSAAPLSPWLAWYRVLTDGFRVFSESVADLQLVAPKLEDRLLSRLLLTGHVGPRDLEELTAAMDAERTKLDERYALDADELHDEEAEQGFLEVAAVDGFDEELGKAMSDWWEQTLGLARDLGDQGSFQLQWDNSTKLPEIPWRERIERCLGRPLTYQRKAALADLSMRLIRTGCPLVDTVPGLLRYDDRGSAFATWRHVPQFAVTGEEWIIFKCVFVIEIDAAARSRDRNDEIDVALQRRLDRLAPPWIETVYLDNDFRHIIRQDLLELAGRQYGGSDRNLGSRPAVLESRIPPRQLGDLARGAAGAGLEILVASIPYQQRRLMALDRADRRVARARTKLERMRAGSRRLGEGLIQLDEDANRLEDEFRLMGLLRPRLDSIGIIILSGEVVA